LLGTGNPRSILLFAASGADSFDGLEWCQTAVDHTTGLLYHFQQRELFGEQTSFGAASGVPYAQATMAHNLAFYRAWMNQIRGAIQQGDVPEMLRKHFSQDFLHRLAAAVPSLGL
jgi:queuine/archaeosine tRNA-ribosyltransferase